MTDPKHIATSIERLKSQSNSDIRQVRQNAVHQIVPELVSACDEELRIRGSIEFDTERARLAVKHNDQVAGMTLPEVVKLAFGEIPARDYEVRLLRAIQSMPGAPYKEIESTYGKKDAALVAGHFVYDRFGFFRRFLETESDQSSILLTKARTAQGITWALKPDVEKALQNLGLFP